MGTGDLTLCRVIRVHLLSILDGSPHEVPVQKVITLDLGDYCHLWTTSRQINGDKIVLIIGLEFPGSESVSYRRELIVWDWRTGGLVSNFLRGRPVLTLPRPRYSNTRAVTQISVARSLGLHKRASWRDPGCSLCPMKAPFPS